MYGFGFSGWIYPDQEQIADSCWTPDRKRGSCVSIQVCEGIKQLLHSTKPITPAVASILTQYQCGMDGHEIKVCCPPKSINLLDSRFGGALVALKAPYISASLFWRKLGRKGNEKVVPLGLTGVRETLRQIMTEIRKFVN